MGFIGESPFGHVVVFFAVVFIRRVHIYLVEYLHFIIFPSTGRDVLEHSRSSRISRISSTGYIVERLQFVDRKFSNENFIKKIESEETVFHFFLLNLKILRFGLTVVYDNCRFRLHNYDSKLILWFLFFVFFGSEIFMKIFMNRVKSTGRRVRKDKNEISY